MKVYFKLLIVLITCGYCSAILDVDLSNVDLVNYKYFKNQPSPQNYVDAQQHPLLENLKPARLVATYFRNLLFGHPWLKTQFNYAFDPDFGKKYRASYQRQFGFRGENLIALVGNGYSKKQLEYYGAVGKNFEHF